MIALFSTVAVKLSWTEFVCVDSLLQLRQSCQSKDKNKRLTGTSGCEKVAVWLYMAL